MFCQAAMTYSNWLCQKMITEIEKMSSDIVVSDIHYVLSDKTIEKKGLKNFSKTWTIPISDVLKQ